MPLRPPFVTVVASTAMLAAACNNGGGPSPDLPTATPTPTPTSSPTGAPAGTLPHWDDVKSGHPEGATNPPSAMLVLTSDGRCHKQWHAGMLRFPPEVQSLELAGQTFATRIVEGAEPGEPQGSGKAIAITCPKGAAEARAQHAPTGAPPTTTPE